MENVCLLSNFVFIWAKRDFPDTFKCIEFHSKESYEFSGGQTFRISFFLRVDPNKYVIHCLKGKA